MNPALKRWFIIVLLVALILGATFARAADAPPASGPNPAPESSGTYAALQEEGKLNLQDTLKTRAPDLAGENPWEQTDPVRLVRLLEHTSGYLAYWGVIGLRTWV